MTYTVKFRRRLTELIVAGSFIVIVISPTVTAAGISIHYGNPYHGLSIGQHSSHGAVGNVTINRQSPSSHSHLRSSQYYGQSHHNNNYYSSPGYRSYRSPTYNSYRSYNSPAQRYYNNTYTQPYRDSRFPNSYRSNSYYPQTLPRSYGNQHRYFVNAWEALAQGQTRTALQQFSAEAQAYPKSGIPKIGYALSAASSGDLRQGTVAMRRAFKIDPDGLRYYQLNPQIQPLVIDLISKYQYKLHKRGRRKDEAFMVAALSYMNHDYPAAYQALERGRKDGDRSKSYRNLREFVNNSKTDY